MRALSIASALFTSLALSAAAHAESFIFTPTGGQAITFSLGSRPDGAMNGVMFSFGNVSATSGSVTTTNNIVDFYNTSYFSSTGTGNVDFQYNGVIYASVFTGQQMYSGLESSPTFIDGIYTLGTASSYNNNTNTGVLVIGPVVLAATPLVVTTPEPSGLILLGTGALGFIGAARRRFRKA